MTNATSRKRNVELARVRLLLKRFSCYFIRSLSIVCCTFSAPAQFSLLYATITDGCGNDFFGLAWFIMAGGDFYVDTMFHSFVSTSQSANWNVRSRIGSFSWRHGRCASKRLKVSMHQMFFIFFLFYMVVNIQNHSTIPSFSCYKLSLNCCTWWSK